MTQSPSTTQLGQPQETPIRVGSPFAHTIRKSAYSYLTAEEAVRRESALGGTIASSLLFGFALASAMWFPFGAGVICVLGIVTALYGMFSRFAKVASGMAGAHGVLLALLLFL
jgi:hypothetical protein